jgi:phosphoribosylformimino-5-aminoimidazole carboxamide ribotide isomerase
MGAADVEAEDVGHAGFASGSAAACHASLPHTPHVVTYSPKIPAEIPMPARFSVIPVLDLKAGHVVHARAGDRANYRPIRTPLSPTSAPADVLDGLLALAPFRRIYVADLDAIERTGDHRSTVVVLIDRHQALDVWLDAGFAAADTAIAVAGMHVIPVLGSESLAHDAIVAETTAALGERGCVLSLDYREHRFAGPPMLECAPALWPQNVIVMTLARVGTGAGPDFDRLAAIKSVAGARRVWAAGGVRGPADLEALARLGLAGALVATALHDGRLTREILGAFV